jgi:predicted DNA-binding transcriptional regulator AlpA
VADILPLRTLPAADRPADDRPTPAPALEPLLVSAKSLAKLLGVSLRTIRAMDRAGRLPAPLRLSPGCVRWRYTEILGWLNGGCPTRQAWEARRDARS